MKFKVLLENNFKKGKEIWKKIIAENERRVFIRKEFKI